MLPLTEAVLIAVVGGLVAIVVELIRARRQTSQIRDALTPNGGSSVADAVDRIEEDVREIKTQTEQLRTQAGEHGERLASLEAHLMPGYRRRRREQ